ncbi:MAG: hypothetical protein LBR83_03285 [Clostridiales bacterium]|jgi:hypothetical protein|nr:hypothetical protein [Clostridiales bacterium]
MLPHRLAARPFLRAIVVFQTLAVKLALRLKSIHKRPKQILRVVLYIVVGYLRRFIAHTGSLPSAVISGPLFPS